jgi:hypothetical protein
MDTLSCVCWIHLQISSRDIIMCFASWSYLESLSCEEAPSTWLGSRDTVNGAMLGVTWIPLHYSQGLVRVGVQSAIAHPETEALLRKLMQDRGLPIPADITSSICLTKGANGCQ